jgi:hypothetical protein
MSQTADITIRHDRRESRLRAWLIRVLWLWRATGPLPDLARGGEMSKSAKAQQRLSEAKRKLRDFRNSTRGGDPDPAYDRRVRRALEANIVSAERAVKVYRDAGE